MSLKDKKIILAITGSIAAYKTPQLVRLLIKQGAEVKVIMTKSAKDFVSPLSLSTVSKNPISSEIQEGEEWNNHVELGRWADVFLIAPLSANSLAKMANGICDNILLATYLSANCPVIVAPAMDLDMWKHPATLNNLEKIKSFQNWVIPTEYGELASGLIGEGRMAEPENIINFLHSFFINKQNQNLNKRALITAGPTYELIDPVRFIGNFSTGKMGIAVANELAKSGVNVDLILGPTSEKINHPLVTIHHIISAQEMYEFSQEIFPNVDFAIMTAAVADYKPEHSADSKIKKQDHEALEIKLVENPDIIASLGKIKKSNQTLIGFALETNRELENAQKKLKSKNADYIILNSLNDEGAGFGFDTNKVTVLKSDGTINELPLLSKNKVAEYIVHTILLKSNHDE